VRELRNYGQRQKYCHVSLAYNRRLDTLQAAVLDVKLRHLDRWNGRRAAIAARYRSLLADLPIQLPVVEPGREHVYHLFVIQTENRDAVLQGLKDAGIGAGIHYPIPIHQQPAYADLGYRDGSFPVAEAAAGRLLSLPVYPEMTDEQVDDVAAVLRLLVESR
jgi:dTDP-4-amino-4,6-dideoxygalactose transaminase